MKRVNLHFSKKVIFLFGAVLALASCSKDEVILPEPEPQPLNPKEVIGVYALNEGAYSESDNGTSGSITFYDKQTQQTVGNFYEAVNEKALGINANDLRNYGSKLYCVVTGTDGGENSYVDVMDASTGKSIKRINFFEGTSSYMPRFITFDAGKAYVSNYDGKVCRIDTATLSIDGKVTIGKGLEGIVVANQKIYVANSQHPFYEGKGNVVSVIDVATLTKVRDIEVAINPINLTATPAEDVLVMSRGTYDADWNFQNNAAITRINTTTDLKVEEKKYNNGEVVSAVKTANGLAYAYSATFFKHISLSDGMLGKDFISDETTVNTMYGLDIDDLSDDVYVSDANNYSATEGKVYCFDKAGKKKEEFATGAYPKNVAFRYSYK